MSEYKYLEQFYNNTSIDPENIILEEVDIAGNNVCIYIVTREKSAFYIFTAVGDTDKPIDRDRINHVLIFESQIKQLFKQIK